jgi:hypothetical protein
MALRLMDAKGNMTHELKLGQQVKWEVIDKTLNYCMYAHATGLELDECRKILGRNVTGPAHCFSKDATEEIVLNWNR